MTGNPEDSRRKPAAANPRFLLPPVGTLRAWADRYDHPAIPLINVDLFFDGTAVCSAGWLLRQIARVQEAMLAEMERADAEV